MKPTAVCKNLRNKKMFIPALAHEASNAPSEEIDHSPHCWCTCTLTEVGPDDQPVLGDDVEVRERFRPSGAIVLTDRLVQESHAIVLQIVVSVMEAPESMDENEILD